MKFERKLTGVDAGWLESYKHKTKDLKHWTQVCITGAIPGFCLFGAGGNGKSFSILQTLAENRIIDIQPEDKLVADDDEDIEVDQVERKEFGFNSFVNHTGRITAKGLVMRLCQFPESIHLIQDAESIFDDKHCSGVLRDALHSQDKKLHSKRRVTWTTSNEKGNYDFFFWGAIIIVGNRKPKDDREDMKAVMSRCPFLDFDVNNHELIAKMKEICESGYKHIEGAPLSRDECYTVTEFILRSVEENPELKRDGAGKERLLDFRLQELGFRLFATSKLVKEIAWQDMVLGKLKGLVGAGKRTRKDRIHDEKKAARDFVGQKFKSQHERLTEWCRLTSRSLDWSLEPRDSAAYKAGLNSAKMDLSRKAR